MNWSSPVADLAELAVVRRSGLVESRHLGSLLALDADGSVALAPGARELRFPVGVRHAGTGPPVLAPRDVPGEGGPLTPLESCRASAIASPEGADRGALYGRLLAPPPPVEGG